MFVVVELPFADMRSLANQAETTRLARPTWPIPAADYDFIRNFGVIRNRRKGGLEPWAGEQYYCNAAASLIFVRSPRKEAPLRLEPLFRRLITDGVVSRLEVAFKVRQNTNPISAARAAAGVQVMIRGAGPIPLMKAGLPLARHYRISTTPNRNSIKDAASPLVRHGAPLIYIERTSGDSTGTLEPFDFEQEWRYYGRNTRIATATLTHRAGTNRDLVRQMRIHAVRLHCEFEAFTLVLRACLTGALSASGSERLRDYLHRTAKILLKEKYHGIPQSDLIRLAANGRNALKTGELSGLRVAFKDVSSSLERIVADAAKLGTRAADIFPHQSAPRLYINHRGKLIMGAKYNFGDNTTVYGVIGDKNRVSNAIFGGSNADTELLDLVQLLAQQVGELRKYLAPPEAQQAAEYVETVRQEIEGADLRFGRVKGLLHRLSEVIAGVRDFALPVLETIEAIHHLVG